MSDNRPFEGLVTSPKGVMPHRLRTALEISYRKKKPTGEEGQAVVCWGEGVASLDPAETTVQHFPEQELYGIANQGETLCRLWTAQQPTRFWDCSSYVRQRFLC